MNNDTVYTKEKFLQIKDILFRFIDACVAQWLEQSTGNRKTWARVPAQSKTSFFPQKDFKFLN